MSTIKAINYQHPTGASANLTLDSSGNVLMDSGYGAPAIAFGCRAWVNFNGTGTVAIRASGNVSSITDNGVGDYTVNFATALVDASYSVSVNSAQISNKSGSYTTSSVNVTTGYPSSTGGAVAFVDPGTVVVMVVR